MYASFVTHDVIYSALFFLSGYGATAFLSSRRLRVALICQIHFLDRIQRQKSCHVVVSWRSITVLATVLFCVHFNVKARFHTHEICNSLGLLGEPDRFRASTCPILILKLRMSQIRESLSQVTLQLVFHILIWQSNHFYIYTILNS